MTSDNNSTMSTISSSESSVHADLEADLAPESNVVETSKDPEANTSEANVPETSTPPSNPSATDKPAAGDKPELLQVYKILLEEPEPCHHHEEESSSNGSFELDHGHCKFNACMQVVPDDYNEFCPEHTCSVEECVNLRSVVRDAMTIYCDEHRCDNTFCPNRKFEDNLDGHYRPYQFCQECLCCQLVDGEICPNLRRRGYPFCTVHCNENGDKQAKEMQAVRQQQQAWAQYVESRNLELRQTQAFIYHQQYLKFQKDQENVPNVGRCLNVYWKKDSQVQCLGNAVLPSLYCHNCNCAIDGCDRPISAGFYCSKHICNRSDCVQSSMSGSLFCSQHRCLLTSGGERCSNQAYEENWFCSDHICHYDSCESAHDGSFYCNAHYSSMDY